MKQFRKKEKKLIALCMIICMLATLIVAPASTVASGEGGIEYDVLLNRLGISAVNDDVSLITRGDFTVLCVQALNITALTEENYFHDVEGEQAKYINTAALLGIVMQSEDKLFHPDRPVKTEEAAAMCLRMLGYDTFLTGADAYPNGCISQASKLRLIRNMAVGRNITCTEATEMIYKTLDTEYIDSAYLAVVEDTKYYKSGKTYLERNFGIMKWHGKVTSVCGVALNGCEIAKPGKIAINSVVYDSPYYSDFKNYIYLGRNVTIYTRYNDGATEIIYILDSEEIEKISMHNVTNVVGFNAGDPYSARRSPKLSYSNGSKNSTINISDNATIIKNGVVVVSIKNEDFMAESGKVFLTDSDNNGSYDVVSIEEYRYYYVTHYESELGIIQDKYGKPEIRLSEFEDERVCVLSDGGVVANSVVEIMCTHNSDGSIDYDKMIRIETKSLTIEGTIESYDEDGIWIDGKLYRVLSTILPELKDRVNRKTTFYLADDNYIVAYDDFVDTEALDYAYLVALDKGAELFGYDFIFRLFLITDKMIDVKLSDNFRYTGMYKGKYVVKAKIKDKDILSTITPYQLVRYRLDKEGRLELLETALDRSSEEGYIGYDLNRFTLDFQSQSTHVWSIYVGDYHAINTNTTFFYVDTDSIEEEDFEIGDRHHRNWNLYGASVKLYNADKSFRGEIVVVENYNAPVTATADFMTNPTSIVAGKKMKQNEDGEYVTHLMLYNNAQLSEYVGQSEDLAPLNETYWGIPTNRVKKFSDLKVGDVIVYQLGLNKNVVNYIVVGEYDPTFTESHYEGYSKPSNIMALAQIATVKGRITSFVDGSHFTVDSSGDQKHCFIRRAATYFEYNPATRTVKRSGTMPHLNVGDYVYVNLFRSDVFIVVKYVE